MGLCCRGGEGRSEGGGRKGRGGVRKGGEEGGVAGRLPMLYGSGFLSQELHQLLSLLAQGLSELTLGG